MTQLITIEITVTGLADEAFPIWLNFDLIDRHGAHHHFEEKAPVVLSENESVPDSFPEIIRIKCRLIETYDDYSVISTAEPHNIISSTGKSRFELPLSAIHRGPKA